GIGYYFTSRAYADKSKLASWPTISPEYIRLHTGEWQVTSPVTIINPNAYPLYSVLVKFVIEGEGVPAPSLEINQDALPLNGTDQQVAFTLLATHPKHPTVFIFIDKIP